MFSNIANYLFGVNQRDASDDSNNVAAAQDCSSRNDDNSKENVNFHEIEEDDWMVVDKLLVANKNHDEDDDDDDLIVSSETYIAIPTSFAAAAPLYDEYDRNITSNSNLKTSRSGISERNAPSSRRRSISCKRLQHVNRPRCSTPLREHSPATSKAVVLYVPPMLLPPPPPSLQQLPRKGSRSSSKSSTCGMEESWYVTPPPCFVSGPYETKPSSLENLLIEQPGVQFFNNLRQEANGESYTANDTKIALATSVAVKHRQNTRTRTNKSKTNAAVSKQRKDATGTAVVADSAAVAVNDTVATTSVEQKENIDTNNSRRHRQHHQLLDHHQQSDDKRKLLLEVHEQKRFVNACQSQINFAQKVEQKAPNQFCKRNQIERSNKVQYELSSRKKRQRRADLNKKHSGVNNNRKSCYTY